MAVSRFDLEKGYGSRMAREVTRQHNLNPLCTLKPQSNGPLYSNTAIGTVVVDGWAVTFGTARKGLGRLRSCPVPSSLYQM